MAQTMTTSDLHQLEDDTNRVLEMAGIRTMYHGADGAGRPLDAQVRASIAGDGQSVLIQVAYPEHLTTDAARRNRTRQLAQQARSVLAEHGLTIAEDPDKDRPRFATFDSGWFGVVTRRMTFSGLLAIMFTGQPFTPEQSSYISAWLAAEKSRKQAIREQVTAMSDAYSLGVPSAMMHLGGLPVIPGYPVIVGSSGPIGYVEELADGWRGTYQESYVGDVRGPIRATLSEAAVDVVAELVFRKLPTR